MKNGGSLAETLLAALGDELGEVVQQALQRSNSRKPALDDTHPTDANVETPAAMKASADPSSTITAPSQNLKSSQSKATVRVKTVPLTAEQLKLIQEQLGHKRDVAASDMNDHDALSAERLQKTLTSEFEKLFQSLGEADHLNEEEEEQH